MKKQKENRVEGKAVALPSILILFLGTLLILAQLAYMTFDFLCGEHVNSLYTQMIYQKCMDYILLEFLILVIGSFLVDITAKELNGTL